MSTHETASHLVLYDLVCVKISQVLLQYYFYLKIPRMKKWPWKFNMKRVKGRYIAVAGRLCVFSLLGHRAIVGEQQYLCWVRGQLQDAWAVSFS